MKNKDRQHDPLLTEIARDYEPQDYVATTLMPTFEINSQSGTYYKWERDNTRIADTERAPHSETNEVPPRQWEEAGLFAQEHSLKELVPFSEIENAVAGQDPIDNAAQHVRDLVMVGAEKGTADLLRDETVITQYTELTSTDKWSDAANSTPIEDVNTGKDAVEAAIGYEPNTLVLSRDAFNALKVNESINERLKYTMPDTATKDLLATIFDVDNVVVARSQYNTAAPGQDPNMVNIWGTDAFLAYVDPDPRGKKTVSLGFHFTWQDHLAEQWESKDPKGQYVRDTWYYDRELVAPEAGYLIKSAA